MSFTPSKTLPPITYDADPRSYHALGAKTPRGDAARIMSRSELQEFGRCPLRWVLGAKDHSTDSMEWGALIDCLFLTRDLFEQAYAICPETYPATPKKKGDPVELKEWNNNATFCREWCAEQRAAGKAIVKSDDASAAHKAVSRLNEDSELSKVRNASRTQVQVCVDWTDETTGRVVPVKAMIDLVPDPKSDYGSTLFDLKTCRSAGPGGWPRVVFSEGYHYQAALYLDAFNAATGLRYTNFGHILQENEPPYEIARRLLSPEFIELGRTQYQNDLCEYVYCLNRNAWPGYDDRPSRDVVNGWRVVDVEPWMITAREV